MTGYFPYSDSAISGLSLVESTGELGPLPHPLPEGEGKEKKNNSHAKKNLQGRHVFASALQAFSFVMFRATQALGSKEKSLAMPYFHMGKPHTIIGAEQFHF
jgi:hypothetical protein